MSIKIIKAGVQTTVQGAPYAGHRHLGMPAAGSADSLSLALANHLVGNSHDSAALEITLGNFSFLSEAATNIAVTGANVELTLNGEAQNLHQSISLQSGDLIAVGPTMRGCRSYLAVAGSFEATTVLNGCSTYQPAKLGGFHGRALRDGDLIGIADCTVMDTVVRQTPEQYTPVVSNNVIMRVTKGPEFDQLSYQSQNQLLDSRWTVDRRASRMGMQLTNHNLQIENAESMLSAPVFPGTIQCPPDGSPFLLGPDAQTTGGYPRIAQVIRADRHLIGQLKPGACVRFVHTTPEKATDIYREKLEILKPWLGEIKLW